MNDMVGERLIEADHLHRVIAARDLQVRSGLGKDPAGGRHRRREEIPGRQAHPRGYPARTA